MESVMVYVVVVVGGVVDGVQYDYRNLFGRLDDYSQNFVADFHHDFRPR